MKIKTVYLAGGINGLSDADANGWRTRAKELLPREIGVLDPMSRDYRGSEDENVADIVHGDLADIKQCQAMIANCPRPSWGTAMEIHWTHHLCNDSSGYRSCKIVAVVPDGVPVSPWLRFHADAVVSTLEKAVAKVVEWAD